MLGTWRVFWVAVIALWAVFASFHRLGRPPVYVTNEAREGVYVRAMLESGDFVAPPVPNHVENGELVPDKPPLFHWLSAAAVWIRESANPSPSGTKLSQRVDEWALRFPSAFSGCLLALALALGGAALVGERAALFAAAALLTSWQFAYQAHFGRVDMTFTCFASIALLVAGQALVRGRPRLLPSAGALAGLAVLAKGPLGVVLPLLGCGSFLGVRAWQSRSLESLHQLPWRRTIGALLLVALPWYGVAIWTSSGAVLRSQIFAENLDQWSGANGAMRPFFYLWTWLLDSFPWNIVAVAAVGEVWRRRDAGPVFCAVWWLSMLLFFQIAAYKRRAYLLPALPAEALLAGWFIDVVVLGDRPTPIVAGFTAIARSLARPALACAAAALLGALSVPLVNRAWLHEGALSAADGALGSAGVVATIWAAVWFARSVIDGDRWRSMAALWIGLGAVYGFVFPTGAIALAEGIAAKQFVARIEAALPRAKRLTICGLKPDPSLIVLYYFRDPERIDVLEDGFCPSALPAGFYLVSEAEWARHQRGAEPDRWREILRGEVRGWTARNPLIFAERLRVPPAEAASPRGVLGRRPFPRSLI